MLNLSSIEYHVDTSRRGLIKLAPVPIEVGVNMDDRISRSTVRRDGWGH